MEVFVGSFIGAVVGSVAVLFGCGMWGRLSNRMLRRREYRRRAAENARFGYMTEWRDGVPYRKK